jgi:hypothetical protein
MEKQAGGRRNPESKRNGEWEDQAFRADKTPYPNANLDSCSNCHKPQGASNDFVYSYDKIKVVAQQAIATVRAVCDGLNQREERVVAEALC